MGWGGESVPFCGTTIHINIRNISLISRDRVITNGIKVKRFDPGELTFIDKGKPFLSNVARQHFPIPVRGAVHRRQQVNAIVAAKFANPVMVENGDFRGHV